MTTERSAQAVFASGELTPIHYAVDQLDKTIAELQARKRELMALLPDQAPCKKVEIVDPRGPKKAKKGGRI